jgi:hypothetical protein
MIKTIEQRFEEYVELSGNNCCQAHRAAARRVFFCAASSFYRLNKEIAHLATIEAKRATVKSVRDELLAFAAEMKLEADAQTTVEKIKPHLSKNQDAGHN